MPLFNRVTLVTPESVELEFTLAGIGSRALALAIDYNIIGLSLAALWIGFLIFSTQLLSYLVGLNVNVSGAPLWLIAIGLLLTFILTTGYFVYFEVTWQGQTPGKRFAKIRVIREDGRPAGLPQALIRTLLRPIDDVLFVGVFFILFNRREKRIGDLVAGTLVVQEERPGAKTTIALSPEAEALAIEIPQLTNLSQLLPDDFATIKEYLERRKFMEPQARSSLSLDLARQAKKLVSLQAIPPKLTSDQFLEALYIAYQQQFSSE